MAKPRQLTPSCFNGGQIVFNLNPDPVQKTRTEKVVKDIYLDANGAETFTVTDNPRLIHAVNPSGHRLFVDENGADTVNMMSADGSIQYEPKMVQKQGEDIVTIPVTWPDGSPRISFGTMRYAPPILCKQLDAAGNRVPYAGDPSHPIAYTEEDLTQEEVLALQALFAGFLARVSTEDGLYPSPAAATAAGA